jgi:predicted ATP-grasp superfamily ATP-dependent carboligase
MLSLVSHREALLRRTRTTPTAGSTRPVPAIVLGGEANALAAARSLDRAGVPVFIVNQPGAPVQRSRYGTWVPVPSAGSIVEAWQAFLLGPESDYLQGAVLLACCDPALEILARHRQAFAKKFLLDHVNPETQVAMLNKLRTYQIAAAAGIATPRFWIVQRDHDVRALEPELSYPLIVKPSHTHVFRHHFGKKFVIVHDFAQLQEACQCVRDLGIDMMLVEFIPGADDRLCSYYTYLDDEGTPLFHFTKRVIRRYPAIMGPACYHITDWNPEVRDAGLAFFRAARLRGLGNVEFKRDPRDGRLKLIECNARMTEATGLVVAAGLDLPLFIYNRVTNRPQIDVSSYKQGLRLWYPLEDFHAFRQLHRQGELSWWRYLQSIAHPHVYPFFRWRDPRPGVCRMFGRLKEALGRRLRRLFGRKAAP